MRKFQNVPVRAAQRRLRPPPRQKQPVPRQIPAHRRIPAHRQPLPVKRNPCLWSTQPEAKP